MADKTIGELKELFSTGKKPKGADFASLIDVTFNAPIETKKLVTSSVDEELPFEKIVGFRMSSSGAIGTNAVNWHYVDRIPSNPSKTYRITSPETNPDCRILKFSSTNAYLGNSAVKPNQPFTLESNVSWFSVNLGFGSPSPNSTPPIIGFSTREAVLATKLFATSSIYSYEPEYISFSKAFDRSIGDSFNALKVLMVGNSFSEDAQQYIREIFASANKDVVFGNLHRPSETLQGHHTQITSGANSYTYHKRASFNGEVAHIQIPNTSFLTALTDEDWDIITYQQGSPLSGQYTTFAPHLQNIITYVRQNATNPNLKHALFMTWAYPTTSTETGFGNYDNNQMTMYNAIVDTHKSAMLNHDIDYLIPVGTAIQNARTLPNLQSLDSDMASDGFHLGPLGDYIAGLTLFEVLATGDIMKDVTHFVQSKSLSYFGKIAVKNAVDNPFIVTDI